MSTKSSDDSDYDIRKAPPAPRACGMGNFMTSTLSDDSDDDIRKPPPAPWARGMGNFMGNWLWLKEPSFGHDSSSDEAEQYRDPWNYVPLAKTSGYIPHSEAKGRKPSTMSPSTMSERPAKGRKRAPSTMSERPKMQKARKQKPLSPVPKVDKKEATKKNDDGAEEIPYAEIKSILRRHQSILREEAAVKVKNFAFNNNFEQFIEPK